ncbi:MAG: ABC transporter ATP-binding protein [Sedimentisphaeraceae bacterium JB056]
MGYIINCKNIEKSYRLGDTHLKVLRGVDISVKSGEFLTITGSSGSGKSTLLHILGALDKPDKGDVHFHGDNITRFSSRRLNSFRNKDVGFIFQFYHLIEELNVVENVLMPVMADYSAIGWFGKRKKYRAEAIELLDKLGLSERLKHRPSQLSGGERQRVAIGRALINKPQVLLADEPTGNLDWPTGQGILEILRKLHKEAGQTIIMVTHDKRVADMGDRQVVLQDGKVV